MKGYIIDRDSNKIARIMLLHKQAGWKEIYRNT